MTRFVLYLGPPTRLSALVTDPEHSPLNQSRDAHEGREGEDRDGLGLAWYHPAGDDSPAVFHSTRPAWDVPNVAEVARVVDSHCFMAHVRTATVGLGVSVVNCHPFRSGRWAFMHVGSVGGFSGVRPALMERLSEESAAQIKGTTDSEHIFALFRDRHAEMPRDADPADRLGWALAATVDDVRELADGYASGHAVSLNLAVADGEHVAVARYANAAVEHPVTLHMLRPDPSGDHAVPGFLIASAQLLDDDRWEPFPDLSMATAKLGEQPKTRGLRSIVRV